MSKISESEYNCKGGMARATLLVYDSYVSFAHPLFNTPTYNTNHNLAHNTCITNMLMLTTERFFFSLAEYVPNLVDFNFPCLTMGQFFSVVYSIYSLHVWELLA